MTHQTTSPDITSQINKYTRILIAFWTATIVLFIWFETFYARKENLVLAQKIENVYGQNRSERVNDADLLMYANQFITHERNEIFMYAFSLCILWGIGLVGVIWGSKKILIHISERKRIEQILEEQRQKVIQTDRLQALGEMAAGIAHELNQPLAAISAISEGLCLRIESGMAVSNQQVVVEMTDVQLMIDRMSGIINHMRTFSRDTTNDTPTTFHISEIIENALTFMRVQLKSHGIQTTLYIDKNLPPCKGWPHQMEEVILNILINARDELDLKNERHNMTNGTPWQPQISINAKATENQIDIDISDNGNGIPEAVMDKVFNPFFTTKEVGKGTGLGLSISKSIVEKHGGTLNVYNQPNDGVTFSISVPIENAELGYENQNILQCTT